MRYAIRTSAICLLSSIVFVAIDNAGRPGFKWRDTLHASRDTKYTCTKVYVRKNKLFMQNKANFQKVKLNVNKVLTKDYEQMDTWSIRKKQSQTKPNKANSKPIKANSNPNKPNFRANICYCSLLFYLKKQIIFCDKMSHIICNCSPSASYTITVPAYLLLSGRNSVSKLGI